MVSGHVTRASALAETDNVDSELASFTVSSRRPRWRWRWWGTGCVVVRPQGWNGFRGADDSSPHGALFRRVHGRTLRTVENTGELVKLGHAANHSVVGENTEPQGVCQDALSELASHKWNCLFNNILSHRPQSDLTDRWNVPLELQKFLRLHFDNQRVRVQHCTCSALERVCR